MRAYLDLLEYILENGEVRDDRTKTGTISSFGHQLKFDLSDGFPAVTTKSLAWKGVVSELLWFLEGSSDERRLAEIRYNKPRSELKDLSKFSTIWTDNADNQGKELGYINTDTIKELGPPPWQSTCKSPPYLFLGVPGGQGRLPKGFLSRMFFLC